MLEELEELADEVKEIEELADEEDATPGSDCRAPGEAVQLSVRLTSRRAQSPLRTPPS